MNSVFVIMYANIPKYSLIKGIYYVATLNKFTDFENLVTCSVVYKLIVRLAHSDITVR